MMIYDDNQKYFEGFHLPKKKCSKRINMHVFLFHSDQLIYALKFNFLRNNNVSKRCQLHTYSIDSYYIHYSSNLMMNDKIATNDMLLGKGLQVIKYA